MSVFGTGTFTAVGGLTATNTALTDYLREEAEPARYKNYVLRQFCSEAIQPGYMGNTIYAPTITNAVQNATRKDIGGAVSTYSGAQGERSSPSARALSFSKASGELNYYMDVIGVSKVFAATATLRKYLARAAEYLMVGCAQTEEELEIWNAMFYGAHNAGTGVPNAFPNVVGGEALYVDPANDGSAWGTIVSTDYLVPTTLAQIRRKHVKNKNRTFDFMDGKYPFICGPDAVYMLATNVNEAGTQLSFERNSMNKTDVYNNQVVGDVLGVRVIEALSLPEYDGAIGALTNEPSTTATVTMCCSPTPDAVYCHEHQTLNPQLYWSGFQVNTFTPAAEEATLAMDFMAGAFKGVDYATKMLLVPVPVLA